MRKQPVNLEIACKLCGHMEKLCNSHIIPEFVYDDIYDQDPRRFNMLSTEPSKCNKFEQKGIREKLLCEKCEGKLSRYEDHARRVLFGGHEISIQKKPGMITIGKVDYCKFKLFLLSILWRAGVAKHDYFEQVKLGHHERILRQMIMDSDPGEPHQYGCFISPFLVEGKPLSGFMLNPEKIRLNGHTCYRFIFAGLIWVFYVSSHLPDSMIVDTFIAKSGNLTIPFEKANSERFLANLANDFREKGKFKPFSNT